MNSSDNRLAERYAKAYYYAKGQSAAQKLQTINAVYKLMLPLKEQFESPLLPSDQKQKFAGELLGNYKNDAVFSFIMLLINVKRLYLLECIINSMQTIYDKENSLNKATLTSAKNLSDSQIAQIQTRLEKMLNSKLEITRKTDPALIGGVKIQIGDLQIDGSLQGQLAKLQNELL